MEDIFYIGCARINMTKATIHKARATLVERVVFRFFMLTKKVHNIARKLNVKKAIVVDDWVAMML